MQYRRSTTVSFTLYYVSQVFLGDFPETHFDDDTTIAAYEAFKIDLERIEEAIKERNSKLDIPYTYLLPSRIPNSTSM